MDEKIIAQRKSSAARFGVLTDQCDTGYQGKNIVHKGWHVFENQSGEDQRAEITIPESDPERIVPD